PMRARNARWRCDGGYGAMEGLSVGSEDALKRAPTTARSSHRAVAPQTSHWRRDGRSVVVGLAKVGVGEERFLSARPGADKPSAGKNRVATFEMTGSLYGRGTLAGAVTGGTAQQWKGSQWDRRTR